MDTRKIEDVPFEEVHEIQRYGTYFSEKSFWKKIERVAKKVGATSIASCLHAVLYVAG